MIQELAEVLRQKIADSGLVELSGGLAQAWEYNNEKKTKAVYWDFQKQEHVNLVPDSDYASITYFEDFGTQIAGDRAGYYRTELRLIGWVNTLKGANTMTILHGVQETLKRGFNAGQFIGVKCNFTGLLPEDGTLFSRYNYDNAVKKRLQKPYDVFGLSLAVSFNLCLDYVPPKQNTLPFTLA